MHVSPRPPRTLRAVFLLALWIGACNDYDLKGIDKGNTRGDDTGLGGDDTDESWGWDGECEPWDFSPEDVGLTDACSGGEGGFQPIIEWNLGAGKSSRSTVAVGDLDRDGMPEIVANITSLFGNGSLVVARGDGSGILWEVDASIGYGSSPAIGDLDGDGWAEIVVVREYQSSLLAAGDYTVVAYSRLGSPVWESDHFVGDDFDYATALQISDMDHDGSPEVIAGRVILASDGSTRGVGAHGRGCFGTFSFGDLTMDEAAVPAVADLDLDGVEEVIVGDAMYSPDGETLWHDPLQNDAFIGVANLDDDEQGEFVAVTNNTVRGVDTSGARLWGPITLTTASIVSPPAIADLDLDGYPEVVVAGGNTLVVLRRDGTEVWRVPVTDMSGASGASIFDFEGDGYPEIVYIDEIEMAVYDGVTGALKFYSTDHASDTMMDYPVIADVDADGQAEIVVAHAGWDSAVSIYGDRDGTWAPARQVWNQHPYSITNINDDLSIPVHATPNFTTDNSWHSAYDRASGERLTADLEAEILDVCTDDCDLGVLLLAGWVRNRSPDPLPAGTPVALYALVDGAYILADVQHTDTETPATTSSTVMNFIVDAVLASAADMLLLQADDDGTGASGLAECSESNNGVYYTDSLCP